MNDTNDTTGDVPRRLDGNEAIDRAAQQSESTGGRNITDLPGLPIADDTANLRHGPNLHDGLLALLPLVGVWRGEGQADTVVDGQYRFGQQIIFSHDGENYLSYESRFWKIDEDEIEFLCTHSTGVVEIYYGKPVTERAWEVQAASTMVTATGPASLGPGKRLYGLMPNNDLGWVDERLRGDDFFPRMSAQLKRWAG